LPVKPEKWKGGVKLYGTIVGFFGNGGRRKERRIQPAGGPVLRPKKNVKTQDTKTWSKVIKKKKSAHRGGFRGRWGENMRGLLFGQMNSA